MNGPQSLVLRVLEFSGAGYCDYGGSDDPASVRGSIGPTGSGNEISFRSALYVSL